MNVGYARTSTADQIAGLEAQITELKAIGCERIYSEQVSSVGKRPQLQAAIDYVREGDVLIVTKTDRLARSVADLLTIIHALKAKNVEMRILNFGMDTQTPTGNMMLTILASVAEFERSIMLERQREGVAKAKKAGKYKGRKPLSLEIQEKVKNLIKHGTSKAEAARQLKIGEASVYRILKKSSTIKVIET